jgi:hypothetical protein
MNICDYYNSIDNIKYYYNKNIDKYLEENNINNIIIKQIDNYNFYIKNKKEDNYDTMFIKNNNNLYQIDIFRSIIRHDDSLVTIKSNTFTCDKNMLIEHIYNTFKIDKKNINNIISFFESY